MLTSSVRNLHELLQDVSTVQPVSGNLRDLSITGVASDSRQVTAGTLFVAVTGGQADGHRYLRQAKRQGATAAIGSRPPTELIADGLLPSDLVYIQVSESRIALAQASAAYYRHPSRSLTVIGVTGTDGKTSTCSVLESILVAATRTASSPAGKVGLITTVGARICGVESETGLHVTTPDAPIVQRYLAEMREADCLYAIVESTSHGLAQARVAAVEFDIAAVTNITHEHLDYHGSRDAYVAAKARLFQMLYATAQKHGVPRVAVLNADDEGSLSALTNVLEAQSAQAGYAVSVSCYGVQSSADEGAMNRAEIVATNVAYSPDRTRFDVAWGGGLFELETKLIGDFNVQNVLCATAVALALGVEVEDIQTGVAAFGGVSGRMERIDEGQPYLAVVDFAHSPASLERALLTLRELLPKDGASLSGRLIAVFGSAGLRDVAKRRLMGAVSGRLADITIITAEDPRTEDLDAINQAIASGAREYATDDAILIVADRSEAIQRAVQLARPGDIVAAFGKGHERSMCYGETETPWNEQVVMRTALRRQSRVSH